MKLKILGAVSALAILMAVTAYTEANAGSVTETPQVNAAASASASDNTIGLSANTKADLKDDWEKTRETLKTQTRDLQADSKDAYQDIKAKLIDQNEKTADDMTIATGITAKGLLGQPINDVHGKKIGTVKDIILNSEGDAELVVVSDGGFMGVGDKLAAFDYNLVMRQEENGDVIMPLSDDIVKKVAEFSYNPKESSDKVQVIPANGYSVAELLKGKLVNPKDESLGNIENIAFRSGEAAEVIVAFDQKLGVGGEHAAFDFDDLTLAKTRDGNLNFRLNDYQSAKFEEYRKSSTQTN